MPCGLSEAVHAYENPTSAEWTLLCAGLPAFLPEDELLAEDESSPARFHLESRGIFIEA